VALAVPLAFAASRGTGPPTRAVYVARGDLVPGEPLRLTDVRVERLPADEMPVGALRPGSRVLGLVPASAISAGEPLTGLAFIGPRLLDALGGRGLLAVPVRLADAEAVRLLRPGERIDVFAVTDPLGDGAGADEPVGLSDAAADEAATMVAGAASAYRGSDAGTAPTRGSPPSAAAPTAAPPQQTPSPAGSGFGAPLTPPANAASPSPGGVPPGEGGSDARGAPRALAHDVLVLSVPVSGDSGAMNADASADGSGGLVVLAVRGAEAGLLAVAQAQGPLAFAVLP
jgi:hypothetical protein